MAVSSSGRYFAVCDLPSGEVYLFDLIDKTKSVKFGNSIELSDTLAILRVIPPLPSGYRYVKVSNYVDSLGRRISREFQRTMMKNTFNGVCFIGDTLHMIGMLHGYALDTTEKKRFPHYCPIITRFKYSPNIGLIELHPAKYPAGWSENVNSATRLPLASESRGWAVRYEKNEEFYVGCIDYTSIDRGNYDSLCTIAKFNFESYNVDVVLTQPEEFTKDSIYNTLANRSLRVAPDNDVMVVFDYLPYVYNVTKHERLRIIVPEGENKRLLHKARYWLNQKNYDSIQSSILWQITDCIKDSSGKVIVCRQVIKPNSVRWVVEWYTDSGRMEKQVNVSERLSARKVNIRRLMYDFQRKCILALVTNGNSYQLISIH
jgi:hypothetical protein